MTPMRGLILAWGLLLPLGAGAESLQPLVDATPVGGVLRLAPGVYQGPVRVTKSMTIDGNDAATVENDGKGTVLVIQADQVTVKNLHLRGSGRLHNEVDACIQVKGHHNRVEHNRLDDCLFGVDLQQANHNTIRDNDITSYPEDMGMRGDGVRLWYSMDNLVQGNRVRDVRDVVIWYAERNTLVDNEVTGSRYSVHLMYAHDNVVSRNRFDGNAVGVFLMYSDKAILEDNLVRNAAGASGLCVGLKESSGVELRRNRLIYCSAGIYLDASPYQPDMVNTFDDNELAFNGAGVMFHMSLKNNIFRGNNFVGNFLPVGVESRGNAMHSEWLGNSWDTYEGFDRDGDGVGDTPYELLSYSDQLWINIPGVKFFFGSPVLSLLDFLERLAPFTAPTRILHDPKPRLQRQAGDKGEAAHG